MQLQVVVLGAGGQLGREVVSAVATRGHSVRGVASLYLVRRLG
jgi:uncharacterized protein YbjT (DUF2867 family)